MHHLPFTQDNKINGNAQQFEKAITTTTTEITESLQNEPLETQMNSITEKEIAAEAAIEESLTLEDLDTEVSQINTQSKNAEQAESYSRPMSRTSSMTPVIKQYILKEAYLSSESVEFLKI